MKKKLYNVKIDFEIWYDRNFTVEAYDKLEAEVKARQEAWEQTKHLDGIDLPVENDGDWTHDVQDYHTAYVELEEITND
jgi:hypothetical protein